MENGEYFTFVKEKNNIGRGIVIGHTDHDIILGNGLVIAYKGYLKVKFSANGNDAYEYRSKNELIELP